jgi:antitoxin HicB
MRFTYPYVAERDGQVVVVSFPDVPEALTQFGPADDASYVTHDCLVAALRAYVDHRDPIPRPSPVGKRPSVALDALESAKLALAQAMQEKGLTNVALARRLGVTETVVRRLVDLDHRSHIGQVEQALRLLGMRLEISVRAA